MAVIVNKVTFAELAGIGKAGVTLTVQRGKLIETQDGYIDTEHPTNAAYLAKRREKAGPQMAGKPLKKKRPVPKKPQETTTKLAAIDPIDLPEPDDIELPDEQTEQPRDDRPDQLDKIAVELRLKTAQAKRHELKYDQDSGLLIPIESVERAAAKVGAELKIRLQDLPRRITPRILAMARSGSDDREVQAALEREIDEAIESVRVTLGGASGTV